MNYLTEIIICQIKQKKWIPEKKENGEYVMEDCGNKDAGQVDNA